MSLSYYIRTFEDKNGTTERGVSDAKRWMFIPKNKVSTPGVVDINIQRSHDLVMKAKVLALYDKKVDLDELYGSNGWAYNWWNWHYANMNVVIDNVPYSNITRREYELRLFALDVIKLMGLSITTANISFVMCTKRRTKITAFKRPIYKGLYHLSSLNASIIFELAVTSFPYPRHILRLTEKGCHISPVG